LPAAFASPARESLQDYKHRAEKSQLSRRNAARPRRIGPFLLWALTEELVAQGHDITRFAGGDSVTGARLVAACARALRLDGRCRDPLAAHFCLLG